MSLRHVVVVLLLLGLVPAGLAGGEDWPTFRHDARRSGVTSEAIEVDRLGQAWVHRAPHPPQPAWPAPARWDAYAGLRGLRNMRDYDRCFHVSAAADRVYFGSSADDSVVCLDAATGKVRWSFTTNGPVRVPPAVDGDRVYFGSDDGHAYCLSADTGELVWKSGPPASARLVLNDGRFISLFPCRTGVLVDGANAYFACSMLPWEQSFLHAVDAATGKIGGAEHYRRQLDGLTLEGPLLAAGAHLVGPQGRVPPVLFSRSDGRPAGGFKGGGGSFVCVTPDKQLMVGPGNKTGWITESRLGDRSRVRQYASRHAAVVAGERLLLLGDTRLSAMDRATRKPLWQVTLPLTYELIVAADTAFVGCDERVVAVSLSEGGVTGQWSVAGRALGLAVAHGNLLVSTDLGAIHCFRSGDAPAAAFTGPGAKLEPSPKVEGRPPSRLPSDRSLVGRWTFRQSRAGRVGLGGDWTVPRRVRDLVGGVDAEVRGSMAIQRVGAIEALAFDGQGTSVMIREDHKAAKLPTRQISAEAWVRVDQPLKWGGIVGALQDNGDYERGWSLGYTDSTFSFAVCGTAGNGRLGYLKASKPFDPGVWYHVVGTYDGKTQRLYVDGKLAARDVSQRGPINYPPQAFFEIGAYHDKDEYFRLTGMVHEVCVFDRALTVAEVQARHEAKRRAFPVPIRLAAGPWTQFLSRDMAVVRWRTARPSPTRLEYGVGDLEQQHLDPKPRTEHEAHLIGLQPDRVYGYRIGTVEGGINGVTPTFDLDTHFNYTPAADTAPDAVRGDLPTPTSRLAAEVVARCGVDRGIGLVLGCADGELVVELLRQTDLRLVAVDTDAQRVAATRRALRQAGLYGVRGTVRQVTSLDRLPFGGTFANLVTSERRLGEAGWVVEPGEIIRMLRPGGVALLAASPTHDTATWQASLAKGSVGVDISSEDQANWLRFERGPIEGAGVWSHLYGRPDNAAFGGETLGGASSATDLRVQWMGQPGPRAQADRNGRKPSPLAVGGRLFVQGLHRIAALDAYNGTVLWGLEIPPLERFNMPRDSSNWCADESHVFAAIKDRCWQIDARTGRVVRLHSVIAAKGRPWSYDWGYLARAGDHLVGSGVKEESAFVSFWGKADAGWYDARSGPATEKVCSDNLFAVDPATGRRRWVYQDGVILNSTITLAGGRAYFVECRHDAVRQSARRRLGMPELWKNQHLVALDLATGRKVLDQPIDTADGTVVFYMAYGGDKLVIVSSADKAYEVYALDAATGQTAWRQRFAWPGGKGDHGKAMSRPAIVGDKLFVRPRVLNLQTGEDLGVRIPDGGCGTYAATAHALVFRKGNVAMWNHASDELSNWARLRPGCWLSTIPAGGMLLAPEAGGGCSCGSWMETSVGFIPRTAAP